jgi:hypothetical protein
MQNNGWDKMGCCTYGYYKEFKSNPKESQRKAALRADIRNRLKTEKDPVVIAQLKSEFKVLSANKKFFSDDKD